MGWFREIDLVAVTRTVQCARLRQIFGIGHGRLGLGKNKLPCMHLRCMLTSFLIVVV